ncbi:hypothetical protein Fmac_025668 [Flemingia macrophylla]|uniref:Uncharacterized protein n=1 Tax=Flemingia macrophylla TaxID=520843 RepID=A0ABD1LSV7_9FABA
MVASWRCRWMVLMNAAWKGGLGFTNAALTNPVQTNAKALWQNALPRLGKLMKSDTCKARTALLVLIGSVVAADRVSRRGAINGEEGLLFRVFDSDFDGERFGITTYWNVELIGVSGTIVLFIADRSSLGDYELSFGDVKEDPPHSSAYATSEASNSTFFSSSSIFGSFLVSIFSLIFVCSTLFSGGEVVTLALVLPKDNHLGSLPKGKGVTGLARTKSIKPNDV